MREIKFRAWNERLGWKNKDGSDARPQYDYDGYVIYPDGSVEYPEGGWDLSGHKDRVFLEQFTGLKDKNSVEIYEGDILKIKNNGSNQIVSWNNGLLQWETDNFKLWQCNDQMYSCEVIGNIHENGDLLR